MLLALERPPERFREGRIDAQREVSIVVSTRSHCIRRTEHPTKYSTSRFPRLVRGSATFGRIERGSQTLMDEVVKIQLATARDH